MRLALISLTAQLKDSACRGSTSIGSKNWRKQREAHTSPGCFASFQKSDQVIQTTRARRRSGLTSSVPTVVCGLPGWPTVAIRERALHAVGGGLWFAATELEVVVETTVGPAETFDPFEIAVEEDTVLRLAQAQHMAAARDAWPLER